MRRFVCVKKCLPASVILMFTFVSLVILSQVNVAAGADSSIDYDVMPGAEITKISYYLKTVGSSPRLHFEITLKNTSNEPKRFEVRIFLSSGNSVGGPIPRTGKPAVIKPGEEQSRAFPVMQSVLPKGFSIVVKETKYIP